MMNAMATPEEHRALQQQIEDLRAERDELDALLASLRPGDWQRVTTFKQWTVWDVIAHLHLADHMGMTSLAGEAPFRQLMREMRDSGLPMAGFARRWLGDVSGPELASRWHALLTRLCDDLAAADPDIRLPWAGPGMRPRMFATARQMETWAHGWELYDLLELPRLHTERLRNIATIGVRTFGWTFANRQLPVPAPTPYVELRAPDGTRWCWNERRDDEAVIGDAVEFCQVVTQVRNITDTRLAVRGDVATRWMAIAQCFAGAPSEPPAAGSRAPAATNRPAAR